MQDERDGKGGGKRVRRIVEKAEFASAYADMLGLANMNEENFSSPPHDPETGEITEPPEVNHGHAVPVQAGEGGSMWAVTGGGPTICRKVSRLKSASCRPMP